jgi:hypothetical protein
VGLRSTSVLLLVAGLLGAFVYFYEIRGEPGRRQARKVEGLLLPGIAEGDIEELTLSAPNAPSVRAARHDGSWRILEPLDFPASQPAFDSMARSLAEMTSEGAIESPAAEDVYGLGSGAPSVRFRAGEADYSLRIGSETPVGWNIYVALRAPADAVPAIHMLGSWRVRAFDRSLDDLRDGRVLDFDRARVERIALSWREGSASSADRYRVVLQREAAGWRIEQPEALEADPAAVESLLAALALVEATGFVDDPPDLAAVGLARPDYEATLLVGGDAERRELVLSVGDREDAGEPARSVAIVRRYVRGSPASLYLVPESRIAPLPRTLFALRFKRVADFSHAAARAIELVFRTAPDAPETLRLERDSDAADWSLAGQAVATDRVDELLAALSELDAIAVVADAMGPAEREALGLDPPNLHVRVYGDEGAGDTVVALADLRLGSAESSSGGVLAISGDRPEIFRLDASLAEVLPLAVASFRDRFLESGSANESGEADPVADGPESGS